MRLTPNLHVGLVLGIATASVILALGGCVTGGATMDRGSAAAPEASPQPSAASLEPFSESERERILAVQSIVAEAASEHGLDVDLINAVIWVESRFDPDAKSPAGARGLMQLMPATAAALAKQMGERSPHAYDPEFNVRAGALYLAEMIEKFGEERYAVAAYHAGPGNVKRWLEAGQAFPDYSETYVAKVMDARSRFEGGAEHEAAAAVLASKPEPEPEPLEVPDDISTLPDAAEIHGVDRVVYVNRRPAKKSLPTPAVDPIEHDDEKEIEEEPVFVVHRDLDANPSSQSSWRRPEPQPTPQPRSRRAAPKAAPKPEPAPKPAPKPEPEPPAEEAGLGVLPDL